MSAQRFRKRPVEVEAIQFTGSNVAEIWDVFGADGIYGPTEKNPDHLVLTTVHGDPAPARVGDWVLRDAAPGTFYPCKPDVFAETYEPAPRVAAYDFGWVLTRLREGMKATRTTWEPYGQYVVLRNGYPRGIGINADTAQATGLPEGERRVFRPYLMLHCADLSFVPWQPTVSDVLADDWMTATADGQIVWEDGTVA